MRRIAAAGIVVVAGAAALSLSATGCRRGATVARAPDPASASRLRGVVDPWTWPRALDASDRERALEDIGPYEHVDPQRDDSPLVNSNADYWTNLVGLAWTRDVDMDFDNQPVDLDADGLPDTRITRHIHAKGGILANPELFGLVRTPDDPRGRKGRVSASTGLLGLREALTPDGNATGQIGMTCFLCHGGRDPDTGRIVLGLPGTAFDYGLLLATAAVLDESAPGPHANPAAANTNTNTGTGTGTNAGGPDAAAYRRAHGFPPGRVVRARLLLAGPGRQDLTGEFGLDVTIPGIHSARYPGTARVRQGTTGIFNPISVPGILAAAGVDLQNWSGSESASPRWLRRMLALGARFRGTDILRLLDLPAPIHPDDPREAAATRRALLLDLRNLGTLGLQQDSFPGLLWADGVYGRTDLDPGELAAIPPMYATAAIRRVLAHEGELTHEEQSDPLSRDRQKETSRTKVHPLNLNREALLASIARGRDIFANRFVGVIANRQILKEPPLRYAAIKPDGPTHAPLVAPIDEALPPSFPVRCADCHNATPGGPPLPLAQAPPPLGRCSHCHHAHVAVTEQNDHDRHPLSWFKWPTAPVPEVALCAGCHQRHRPFTPVAYSSSMLFPFDADGDGAAQDDERDDARAGGIGTEALLAFDVPRPQRPLTGFALDLPSLTAVHSVGPVAVTRIGAGWVRAAPLLGVRATAPYLHNGSVPTLRALLEPAPRRPVTFPLGDAGFVFDTRLAGNRNIGHEFGTALTAGEKDDLIAFLESL